MRCSNSRNFFRTYARRKHRHSIFFSDQLLRTPSRRFEFGPGGGSETIGSELPISYAPHVLCEYNGSHPDVHVTFDRHLSDNEKETRMKASESLQNDQSTATEKALRLAFDTTPAFIHTARPDGYFDYFNRRWLDFLGKSLEDVCGWRWTESVHPEDVGWNSSKMACGFGKWGTVRSRSARSMWGRNISRVFAPEGAAP